MKLLITEPKDFSIDAIESLEKTGFSVTSLQCNHDKLRDIIGDYNGIIVRLGITIDSEILRNAKKLKFIATPTTGLDHINPEETKKRNITVISLKGETEFLEKITPTAELAVGLILAVLRNIVPASISVQDGNWNRDMWMGRTMQGKTVGIVGMGRLGIITTRLVKAFGCNVIYYDPFVFTKKERKIKNLAELAAKADIVSIHVPLNKKTKKMITTEFFNNSKPGQIMINTSRGAVIDERVLINALKQGKISGAGLDVLKDELSESVVNSKLVKYARENSNLVITPHIGGATNEAMRMTEIFVADKILDWWNVKKKVIEAKQLVQ